MTSRPASDYRTAAMHVGYELVSMVEMALRLNAHTTDALVSNALLEAMLLHSRTLIDFLGPWPHQKSDFVPEDFVAGWDPALLKVSDAARTAIHKHLAHLTWTRVDEGKVAWEFPGIVSQVFQAVGKFVEHCEANQAPVAGILSAHYEVALRTIEAMASADSEVSFTTASTDAALQLADFRNAVSPEGSEATDGGE